MTARIGDKPANKPVARALDPAEPTVAPGPTKPIIRAFDPAEPTPAPAPTKEIGRILPTRLWPAEGGFTLSPLNKRRWRNFKANRRG